VKNTLISLLDVAVDSASLRAETSEEIRITRQRRLRTRKALEKAMF